MEVNCLSPFLPGPSPCHPYWFAPVVAHAHQPRIRFEKCGFLSSEVIAPQTYKDSRVPHPYSLVAIHPPVCTSITARPLSVEGRVFRGNERKKVPPNEVSHDLFLQRACKIPQPETTPSVSTDNIGFHF